MTSPMMPSWNEVVGFSRIGRVCGGWRPRLPMPVHRAINSVLGNNGKLDGAPAAPPHPRCKTCTDDRLLRQEIRMARHRPVTPR